MAKQIMFGKIADEYEVNGEKKTGWNDIGMKLFVDWEARKVSMIDVRTGKWITFFEARSRHDNKNNQGNQPKSNNNAQYPSSGDELDDDLPF